MPKALLRRANTWEAGVEPWDPRKERQEDGVYNVRRGERAGCPVTTGRYRFSSLGTVPQDNYTRCFTPPAVTGLTPGSVDTGEEGASYEAV